MLVRVLLVFMVYKSTVFTIESPNLVNYLLVHEIRSDEFRKGLELGSNYHSNTSGQHLVVVKGLSIYYLCNFIIFYTCICAALV